MAKAFLSDAKKEKFWSTVKEGDSMPNSSNEEIVDLLKQLLWKQNRYAANNAKYSPTRHRSQCLGKTQYDGLQTKRQKIARDRNGFMGRVVERIPVSRKLGPSLPPLAPLWADAPTLPPTESQSPSHVLHASISTTHPKGRILIPFYIWRHSIGMIRQSFWEEGRFGSKSLEEFLPDVAAKLKCASNDIERIKLVLRLKTREVEIEMGAGNEDIWDIAMATFRDEIKRAKVKGEVEGINVLVKPIMRKGGAETRDWNEDEEFDL